MKNPQAAGLNQRQVRAAISLAAGRTLRAAAKEAGCSERAAREWTTQPEFRRFVAHLQEQAIRRSVGILGRATAKAVRRLVTLVDSQDEGVALRASVAILDSAIRFTEHVSLVSRVAELEALASPSSPSLPGVHL